MMNATTSLATVLVRSDIGVFRIHLGDGASEVATSLSNGHCFQVLPVFALPSAPTCISDSVAAFVAESGGNALGNGWFAGVALDMLAAYMVHLCITEWSHQAIAPEHKLPPTVASSVDVAPTTPPAASSGSASNSHTSSPPVVLADGGHDSGDEEPASEVEGVVDEIWLHVEGTSVADADKAADIRSAIENRLGKQEAKHLLACTRTTVAKQNGHKNRIMRIGRIALRLRRDPVL